MGNPQPSPKRHSSHGCRSQTKWWWVCPAGLRYSRAPLEIGEKAEYHRSVGEPAEGSLTHIVLVLTMRTEHNPRWCSREKHTLLPISSPWQDQHGEARRVPCYGEWTEREVSPTLPIHSVYQPKLRSTLPPPDKGKPLLGVTHNISLFVTWSYLEYNLYSTTKDNSQQRISWLS